ncbi:C-terminal binding protein [bacterium]|nr:C-terminal binding protein [bacterium]
MKSNSVYITDYVDNPSIEREVLGDALAPEPHDGIEVLIVWHDLINEEYLARFPNLKAVVRYGVGYDNLDLVATKDRGVYACNTPDYGVDEVSDTAIAMIMAISRGIVRYDSLSRGYRDTWQENTHKEIRRGAEQTVGVLGAGRIGGSVLFKAKALGFKTVLYDPYRPSGHEKTFGSSRTESMHELLGICDIVSVHVPLSEATKGMIDREFVESIKDGASLVNTARGKLVEDLEVFHEPLESGKLGYVYLDVLPDEPPVDSPLVNAWRAREDWIDGRFLINPHSAYYSGRSYEEMRQKAALNAKRVLEGKTPVNIVNGLE